uniref:Gagpol polyprotein putative n=1 Tax=Albugo laibachii Nc14 TaxID=890382 RepID=F0W4L6_9STRA|nr:gagpol polyprotein putative [Albugo laibachii Nc14]|eukprot:CCA16050.1 gagpol polyprotein putative [Albugo laibachii Nc14]
MVKRQIIRQGINGASPQHFLYIPQGMKISAKDLQRFGVQHSGQMVLRVSSQSIWTETNWTNLESVSFSGELMTRFVCHRSCAHACSRVYVDDLLVTGTSRDAVDKFLKKLIALEIKDLGVVNKFLGLRISLDEEVGYVLDQEVSINLLLKEYGLEKENGIGGVGASSGVVMIESWSDADFAADKSDRKSVSGCVVMIDGAVVLWSCKKQTGVSLSTMEAEFIAASQAGRELLGLRPLFQELGIKIAEPMKMKMDNQALIKQLENEKSTASDKHVDIRFKFICHHAHARVVQPIFVRSGEMIADLLTKALPALRITELRHMFNLKIMHSMGEEEC